MIATRSALARVGPTQTLHPDLVPQRSPLALARAIVIVLGTAWIWSSGLVVWSIIRALVGRVGDAVPGDLIPGNPISGDFVSSLAWWMVLAGLSLATLMFVAIIGGPRRHDG